jgi:hypothetical protein
VGSEMYKRQRFVCHIAVEGRCLPRDTQRQPRSRYESNNSHLLHADVPFLSLVCQIWWYDIVPRNRILG